MSAVTDQQAADDLRFPSFASLRVAHGELLKRHRENGDDPGVLADIQAFIQRGQATGALLDSEEDRQAAQSLLDYWATNLYREGLSPPDASLADFDPSLAPKLEDELCPYLGLDAFDEKNQEVFFGRQRLVENMLAHLEANRLLAVLGPSGSGKSSVVRAGLIPALKAGALPGSRDWVYLPPLDPGSRPLETLDAVLPPDPDADDLDRQGQIRAYFEEPGHFAKQIAQRIGRNTVIVVDQFEELFTLCTDESEQQVFVDNLVALVQDPEWEHVVILTMRTDFESQVTRLPEFQELFEDAIVRVPPLNASELRQAIEEPAQLIGLKFESGVVDALLSDILGEPAALPLLQFSLLKLWEGRDRNRVTWDAYRRLGGGRQALAKSADEFYSDLIPEEQITARRILLRLVRPGEGLEVTSNRMRRDALYHKAEAPGRIDRVLDKFVQARLLRLTRGDLPEDDQIEVAHEALVRNWPALVGWLEDERVRIRERQRLTTAAEKWQDLGQEPSALLRGVLLEEALRYDDLSALEAEFVAESQRSVENAAREREEAAQRELEQARALAQARAESARRLQLLVIVLTIFVILAIVVAYNFSRQSQDYRVLSVTAQYNEQVAEAYAVEAFKAQSTAEAAKEEERVARLKAEEERERANESAEDARKAQAEARSGQLAVQALNQLPENKVLALLLAVEAMNASPSLQAFEANRTLRTVLAEQGRVNQVLAPEDSKSFITDAVWSQAGNRLITLDRGGTVRVWVAKSGLKLFSQSLGGLSSITLSPDGEKVVAIDARGGLLLWMYPFDLPPVVVSDLESLSRRPALWSPDSQAVMTIDEDGVIHIHQLAGESMRELELPTQGLPDLKAFWSPDRAFVLVASGKGGVQIFDANSGELVSELPLEMDALSFVAWSPDGSRIVVVGQSISPKQQAAAGAVQVWDLQNETWIDLLGATAGVNYASWSPDGARIVTTGSDGAARIWDAASGEQLASLTGHTAGVYYAAWSPDGSRLVTAGRDNTARLWDANTGNLIDPLDGHTARVLGAVWSPDGEWIATTSEDGSARIWNGTFNAQAGGEGVSLLGHQGPVQDVTWSPVEPNWVLTAGEDGTARVWDVERGSQVTEFDTLFSSILDADWSPIGKRIAVVGRDGMAIIWDLVAGPDISLQGHEMDVVRVKWSPGGERVLTLSRDGTARLWSAEDGDPGPVFRSQIGNLLSAEWSPDGSEVVTAGEDGTVRLWDAQDGHELLMLIGHTDFVKYAAFDPSGERVISVGDDGSVRVWAAGSGEQLDVFSRSIQEIAFARLSPNGEMLVTINADNAVQVWNLNSGTTLSLEGHSGDVLAAEWSPDSTRIATMGGDGTARIWEVERGNQLALLPGHTDWVTAAAWKPDITRIVTVGRDGTGRVYFVRPVDLLLKACEGAYRNMTYEEWRLYFPSDVPYRKTCDQVPVHPSLIDFSRHLAEMGEKQEAMKLLERAQELQPDLGLDPATEVNKYAALGLVEKSMAFLNSRLLEEMFSSGENPFAGLTSYQLSVIRGAAASSIAGLREAQQLDPSSEIDANIWFVDCLFGAIFSNVEGAMYACDQAVSLVSTTDLSDAILIYFFRGIVRANENDTAGAVQDFEAFRDALVEENSYDDFQQVVSDAFGMDFDAWIEALEAGRNPVSQEQIREHVMEIFP